VVELLYALAILLAAWCLIAIALVAGWVLACFVGRWLPLHLSRRRQARSESPGRRSRRA